VIVNKLKPVDFSENIKKIIIKFLIIKSEKLHKIVNILIKYTHLVILMELLYHQPSFKLCPEKIILFTA